MYPIHFPTGTFPVIPSTPVFFLARLQVPTIRYLWDWSVSVSRREHNQASRSYTPSLPSTLAAGLPSKEKFLTLCTCISIYIKLASFLTSALSVEQDEYPKDLALQTLSPWYLTLAYSSRVLQRVDGAGKKWVDGFI